MKIKLPAIATLCFAACALSFNASAHDTNVQTQVQSIVSNMMKTTMVEVSNELNLSLQRSILKLSHDVSVDNAEKIGTVTITDIVIVKKNEQKRNKSKKEETVNQKSNADD